MKRLQSLSPALRSGTRSQDESASPTLPREAEQESRGIFVLHPKPEYQHGPENAIQVDIVAIHGLNGHARKTWTDLDSGVCWLEHFLPKTIPSARIMTFGYDSRLAFSRSKAGIPTFARDLLNRLRLLRSAAHERYRPLVFISHSLGGILVKKAIIIAHEANNLYGPIFDSTIGILFMGTPHRGSTLASWAHLAANMVNLVTIGRGLRRGLLRDIQPDSSVLKDISSQFIQKATSLKIISFVEQQTEGLLNVLVVPEDSSVLGLPNEMIIPLNRNHRGLCRYSSRTSDYLLIEETLKELIHPHSTVSHALHQGVNPETWITTDAALYSKINHQDDRALEFMKKPQESKPSKRFQTEDDTEMAEGYKNPVSLFPAEIASEPLNGFNTSISRSISSNPERISIRVDGLRHKLTRSTYGKSTFAHLFDVPSNIPLSALGKFLEHERPDTKLCQKFQFMEYGLEIDETWVDCFTTPVEVTLGEPIYNPLHGGLQINSRQTITSFFSRAFPRIIQVKPYQKDDERVSFSSAAASDSIAVIQGAELGLLISFARTIRVPEDSRCHEVPADLGRYPLLDVQSFRRQLPVSMVAQGGIFFPMYEAEAMCIDFQPTSRKRRFAIRPFVDGINGVSGEPSTKNAIHISPAKQGNRAVPMQDYIVIPEQQRLDGIAASPNMVKQFVSAGQESNSSHGTRSFQLQIIPDFCVDAISATSRRDVPSREDARSYKGNHRFSGYNVFSTPEELNLPVGSLIHMKDMSILSPNRPKLVRDLAAEAPESQRSFDAIEISAVYNSPSWKFKVHQARLHMDESTATFDFDEDDSFDAILDIVRNKFSDQKAVLATVGVIQNEAITRIDNWADCLAIQFLIEKSKKYTTELDFRLTDVEPLGPHGFCHVSVNQPSSSRWESSPPIYANILLRPDDTIRELKASLERLGIPCLQLYVINQSGDRYLDSDKVFGNAMSFVDKEAKATTCLQQLWMMPKELHVIVTDNSGEVLYVISPRTKAGKLFENFCDRRQSAVKNYRFLLEGQFIHKDEILACVLHDWDCIEAHQDQVGGGRNEIEVRHKDRRKLLSFSGLSTIGDVKDELAIWVGFPRGSQILVCDGFVLDNDEFTWKYAGASLQLIVIPGTRPRTLMIEAGGHIKQRIERDYSDPRIWDTAGSVILNVQIVDSSAFQLLTGLDPPDKLVTTDFVKWKSGSVAVGIAEDSEISQQYRRAGHAVDEREPAKSCDWNREMTVAKTPQVHESLQNTAESSRKRVSAMANPVVLLDVDGTIPPFRGAVGK